MHLSILSKQRPERLERLPVRILDRPRQGRIRIKITELETDAVRPIDRRDRVCRRFMTRHSAPARCARRGASGLRQMFPRHTKSTTPGVSLVRRALAMALLLPCVRHSNFLRIQRARLRTVPGVESRWAGALAPMPPGRRATARARESRSPRIVGTAELRQSS